MSTKNPNASATHSAPTALIIGGTGLLGRGVAGELKEAGWKVTLLSRGRLPRPPELAACEHLVRDRPRGNGLDDILSERSFDLVVDCAVFTENEARAAVEDFQNRTRHYFFISTDFVYAPDPAATFPVTEENATQNDLAYAQGKRKAEAVFRTAAGATGFPVTLLRPPHIIGAGRPLGCDPMAGGRDPRLPERLRTGETLPLLLGGVFLIQPVWSREVGRAIAALNGRPAALGKTLHCAGAHAITVRRYYELVAQQVGGQLNIRPVSLEEFFETHPEQTHLARHRIYDLSRLREAGYQPSCPLESGLQEALGA